MLKRLCAKHMGMLRRELAIKTHVYMCMLMHVCTCVLTYVRTGGHGRQPPGIILRNTVTFCETVAWLTNRSHRGLDEDLKRWPRLPQASISTGIPRSESSENEDVPCDVQMPAGTRQRQRSVPHSPPPTNRTDIRRWWLIQRNWSADDKLPLSACHVTSQTLEVNEFLGLLCVGGN